MEIIKSYIDYVWTGLRGGSHGTVMFKTYF